MCSNILPPDVVTRSASLYGPCHRLRQSRVRAVDDSARQGIGCGTFSDGRSAGPKRTTIRADRSTSPPSASCSCVHSSVTALPQTHIPCAPLAPALSMLIVTRKMFAAYGSSEITPPSRRAQVGTLGERNAANDTVSTMQPSLCASDFHAKRGPIWDPRQSQRHPSVRHEISIVLRRQRRPSQLENTPLRSLERQRNHIRRAPSSPCSIRLECGKSTRRSHLYILLLYQ